MQCRETPQCFTESTETRQVSDSAIVGEVGPDRATGTAERIERNVEGSEEGQQNGIVIGGAIFVRSSRALTALGALAWTDAFRGPEEILKGVVEVSCPEELDLRLLARLFWRLGGYCPVALHALLCQLALR